MPLLLVIKPDKLNRIIDTHWLPSAATSQDRAKSHHVSRRELALRELKMLALYRKSVKETSAQKNDLLHP
ncbi:hypothetical protein SAMN03159288_01359 [Rhizobium sp. NFACC06-2]|nr:hypothetical protein SAMN03159288_01359 [Rhizobium sp. NFACC06-2]